MLNEKFKWTEEEISLMRSKNPMDFIIKDKYIEKSITTNVGIVERLEYLLKLCICDLGTQRLLILHILAVIMHKHVPEEKAFLNRVKVSKRVDCASMDEIWDEIKAKINIVLDDLRANGLTENINKYYFCCLLFLNVGVEDRAVFVNFAAEKLKVNFLPTDDIIASSIAFVENNMPLEKIWDHEKRVFWDREKRSSWDKGEIDIIENHPEKMSEMLIANIVFFNPEYLRKLKRIMDSADRNLDDQIIGIKYSIPLLLEVIERDGVSKNIDKSILCIAFFISLPKKFMNKIILIAYSNDLQ